MFRAALNEHNRRASKFLLYVRTFVSCASAPPFFEICMGVVLWVRTYAFIVLWFVWAVSYEGRSVS